MVENKDLENNTNSEISATDLKTGHSFEELFFYLVLFRQTEAKKTPDWSHVCQSHRYQSLCLGLGATWDICLASLLHLFVAF